MGRRSRNSGHRGVDLQTRTGEEILAPGDGMVSFTGKVAGKDVVSIKYGDMALTFEPAITDIGVGASVRRGQPFAKVGESSDHCDNVLHWGIRSGEKTYLDPASMVSAYRIVLKPKAEVELVAAAGICHECNLVIWRGDAETNGIPSYEPA